MTFRNAFRHPPWIAVPEVFIDVENVSNLLFDRDAATIAQLLQGNSHSSTSDAKKLDNDDEEEHEQC